MKKLVAEPLGDKIKYVLANDDEPFAYGEFDCEDYHSGDICAAAIRDRHPNTGGYFCEIGDKRTGFYPFGDCKTGDFKLLQVKVPARGTKGVELSDRITLSGRYFVCEFVPDKRSDGRSFSLKLSKKIIDRTLRDKFWREISDIVCENDFCWAGYKLNIIVRTEAEENQSCSLEVKTIISRFCSCELKFEERCADRNYGKIYGVNVFDYITSVYRISRFDEIYISDPALCMEFKKRKGELTGNLIALKPSENGFSLFTLNNAARKLPGLLGRTVSLRSGASIVIEKTEAMTVIDVNAVGAKFTHSEVNLEAAEEIMRQLMLRNIGGIIMCDFINVSEKEETLLLEFLKDLALDDYTECQVHGITALGIVEISRKRV